MREKSIKEVSRRQKSQLGVKMSEDLCIVPQPEKKKRKMTALSQQLKDWVTYKVEKMEKVLEEWTNKELEENVEVVFTCKVDCKEDGAMRLCNPRVTVKGCESAKEMRSYTL